MGIKKEKEFQMGPPLPPHHFPPRRKKKEKKKKLDPQFGKPPLFSHMKEGRRERRGTIYQRERVR